MLIAPIAAGDPLVDQLVREQQAELRRATGPAHIPYPLHDGIEYLVGYEDRQPIACGGLQPLEAGVGEIKRMYVRPRYRRRGYSRLILAALEERATTARYHTLRLETGGFLPAALGLYTGAGYREIPLFGQYVGNRTSVCFEKRLSPPAG